MEVELSRRGSYIGGHSLARRSWGSQRRAINGHALARELILGKVSEFPVGKGYKLALIKEMKKAFGRKFQEKTDYGPNTRLIKKYFLIKKIR